MKSDDAYDIQSDTAFEPRDWRGVRPKRSPQQPADYIGTPEKSAGTVVAKHMKKRRANFHMASTLVYLTESLQNA